MGVIWKKIDVADNELAFVYRRENFREVLEPGRHKIFAFGENIRVEKYDVTQVHFRHELQDFLIKKNRDVLSKYLQYVELSDAQAGLLYFDGVLSNILRPGTKHVFWKGAIDIQVEYVELEEVFEVNDKLLAIASRNRVLTDAITKIVVPDDHVALLVVDGKHRETLKSGTYGFWNFNRSVMSKLVDLRLQAMDVSGQEILTKDRVSLRVNLSATYKVVDPESVIYKIKDFTSFVYRELQLELREAVGTKTLDELLENKDVLNADIKANVVGKLIGYGIALEAVGVKDIILPGDMKHILNQVVEAQKEAEANLIKRREETQAMRSLHNTAKVMENNPVLLRLKELEALERVSSRIDSFTVYNGLDGLLNDVVKFMPKGSVK